MSKSYKSSSELVDRFKKASGQDVPLDYFLYACLENERTIEAKGGKRQIQWPTLSDLPEEDLADEINSQEFRDLIEDLMSWYSANYPDLSASYPWDFSLLSEVVPPLASMVHDLGEVHRMKFDEPIPEIINDEVPNHQSWLTLQDTSERLFGRKAQYVLRYLEWIYAKDKPEVIEPGSRPPVGRFSPNYRGGSDRGPRSKPGGGGRGRGDRGGPRGSRDGQGRSGAGRSGPGRNGGRSEQRPSGRNERGDGRRGGRGGKQHDRSADKQLKEIALKECNDAIDFLESNPSEKEVVLKPQNSFYRRLQHKEIVANGYESKSAGEGHDRSVVVFRKDD